MQTSNETKLANLENVAVELQPKVKEILNKTNLNWDVRKEALVSVDKGLITPMAGIYRDDDDRYLGITSKKYTIYQNAELVETIYTAAKEFKLEINDGGALHEGSRVYLQLALPDEFVGNSQIKRYITAVNSHNGLGSVGFGSTNDILNVTPNGTTNNKFFRMYGAMDKFRHSSNVHERVRSAAHQLFQSLMQDKKTVEAFQAMSSTKLEDELLKSIMMKCYSIDLDVNKDELTPRQANKADKVATIITDEVKKEGNTVWGLFNGILRCTQQSMPKTKVANDYLMGGTGYNLNMKAFNTITKFLESKK